MTKQLPLLPLNTFSIKPTYETEPNFSQVPNWVLDHQYLFPETELRILLFIIRKTIGFHEKTKWCSLTYIMQGTKITSRGKITIALQELLKSHVVKRKVIKTKYGNSYEYLLHDDGYIINMKYLSQRFENSKNERMKKILQARNARYKTNQVVLSTELVLITEPLGGSDNRTQLNKPVINKPVINKLIKNKQKENVSKKVYVPKPVSNKTSQKEFLEAFKKITARNYRTLEAKAQTQLYEIIALGYSMQDIRIALSNASKDQYIRGKNDTGKDYLTPEYFTRIGKFEAFFNTDIKVDENWKDWEDFLTFFNSFTGKIWHGSEESRNNLIQLIKLGRSKIEISQAVKKMWKDPKFHEFFNLETATKPKNIERYLNSN